MCSLPSVERSKQVIPNLKELRLVLASFSRAEIPSSHLEVLEEQGVAQELSQDHNVQNATPEDLICS